MPKKLAMSLLGLFCAIQFPQVLEIIFAKFNLNGKLITAQEGWLRLVEHIGLISIGTSISFSIALILLLWIQSRFGFLFRGLLNHVLIIQQVFPPVAVLALIIPFFGFGFGPVLITLILSSILPPLKNLMSAIDQINPTLEDTCLSLRMTPWQKTTKLYIPLNLPIIFSSLRVVLLTNIGTASLASTVGAGGLGSPIINGLSVYNMPMILQGTLILSFFALCIEYAIRSAETHFTQRFRADKIDPSYL